MHSFASLLGLSIVELVRRHIADHFAGWIGTQCPQLVNLISPADLDAGPSSATYLLSRLPHLQALLGQLSACEICLGYMLLKTGNIEIKALSCLPVTTYKLQELQKGDEECLIECLHRATEREYESTFW